MTLIWTRIKPGLWTCIAHGYKIERAYHGANWRIIRNGRHWDSVRSLRDAKSLCARDAIKAASRGDKQ